MWCKHTNYEQAARIPLIVVAPRVTEPGSSTTALVETVDIYPTLCELAGLDVPDKLDGRSFASVISAPAVAVRESVIHVYPRGRRIGRAIRTRQHRLVEWKVPGDPAESADLELYDYVNDPAETRNLASEKIEVVAQLRALLAEHPEAKPQVQQQAPKAPAKGKSNKNKAKAK